MNGRDGFERRAARLLAGLAQAGAALRDGEGRYELLVSGEDAPRMIADSTVVEAMLAADWLAADHTDLVATAAGRAWLARRLRPDEPWRAQHMQLGTATPDGQGGPVTLAVDDESPIAWLRKRRDADGQPMLSAAEFAAGERLRADYTAARILPRVTADWSSFAAPHKGRGPAADPSTTLDVALAARRRVETALDAVGGDLASLLVDVCCFLVGIEDAERARGWPRRSAKVVLRIGLAALAAHYGIGEEAKGRPHARAILHWGTEDYRPLP